MTHTICSVGFFMYLCVMGTFSKYNTKTFDKLINDSMERILEQMRKIQLEEFKMRMEYLNIELRMEMGGDRGIHSTLKNTQD